MKCPKCQADNQPDSKFCRACAAPLTSEGKDPIVSTKTIEMPPALSLSGTLFADRYHVVEELGRGGMGVVYRAVDNRLREEVALKVIKPEIASDKMALERFSTELKLARWIVHRNVCRMYELMEHGGVRFISMEYVAGEDLKSFIKRARRLDIGTAVEIAIQIGEGLAEAHRLGVVHRDLKPGNIMIDKEGSAKIMDFGIARSRREKGITGEGRMIGTPEYISPEQIDGEDADARSDLYAFGVILYEMVCGTYPFEGDTAHIIAQKIQGKKPPDPKTINPHVPDALAKAVLRCLEKDRVKRYTSADEVLADLRRIEDDLPTTERVTVKARSSVFAGLTRRFDRGKLLWAILGIAAAAMVVVFALRPKPSSPPPAEGAGLSEPPKPVLAVLFFANRTTDPGLEYMRKNLCILFISAIRQLSPGLLVRGQIDVSGLLKKLNLESGEYSADDLSEIARKLAVTHVLTGQLMKLGDSWRIFYELQETASRATVGSGRRSGKPEDLDAMVAALSEQALGNLQVPIRGSVRAIGSRSESANRLYAQARGAEIDAVLSSTKSERDEQLGRMLRKFQDAIKADSGFAAAYWGLGDYYGLLFVESARLQDLNLMKQNYEKAYALAPDLAGANVGLGWARFYDERLDEAYRCFRSAHLLEPDNPEINVNVGSFLFSIGQIEAGTRYFTKAIESGDTTVNPMGPLYRRVISLVNLGRLAEAEKDVRDMIVLESQDASLRILHARILAGMKKAEDAERELAVAASSNPEAPELDLVRASLDAAAGNVKRALPVLDRARRENALGFANFLAESYAQLGMAGEALAVIREGIDKGFSKVFFHLFPYQVLTNGAFDRLKSDPRFLRILEAQKQKHDDQLARYRELCEPSWDR